MKTIHTESREFESYDGIFTVDIWDYRSALELAMEVLASYKDEGYDYKGHRLGGYATAAIKYWDGSEVEIWDSDETPDTIETTGIKGILIQEGDLDYIVYGSYTIDEYGIAELA